MHLLFRFAAAGAVGTLLHYVVLFLLVSAVGIPAATSAMAGALCGGLCNYYLNHRFIFPGSRRHQQSLPKFAAMVVLGMFLNGVIVKALTTAGLHYLLAQLAATFAILILNFFIVKTWIFNKPN
jgi:putative flippase GtrA